MKIKQTCEITAETIHCGWHGLSISDADGGEVEVNLTDTQWLELAEKMNHKADRIRNDHREKIQKELEELEDA
jgi:hypothetical protein